MSYLSDLSNNSQLKSQFSSITVMYLIEAELKSFENDFWIIVVSLCKWVR